ncbi:hypothetical protein [Usitatibacter palustris]|uniref:Zn-dependent PLC domain-containing protein n=1 Tax=Usitatibacter palustris TaxID=2732487 RepID=A0A6M4HBC2_9PROT|nr:hypothetical protein [Usitatibacter palustris]QJR15933.1 hypothetical protein DSM104440_02760 [Usitatibacter palustris]
MTKHIIRFLGLITVLFAAQGVLAWDAGPKQCTTDACTGGVNAATFLDTQPKYANSVIPGRLADCPEGYKNIGIAGCGRGADSISTPSQLASCPSGYTNMGLTCFRPVSSYGNKCLGGCGAGYTNMGCFCSRGADSKSADAMVCPAGYFKDNVVKRCHKNCPAGYTQTGETCFRGVDTKGPDSFICGPGERRGGGLVANKCFPNPGPCSADREEYGISGASLCFTKCPPGSTRTAVSTCSHSVKWRGNTHLYVVLGGVQLLSTSQDPVAQAAAKAMNTPACKAKWQQGVWDADDPDKDLVDNPTGKTAGGTHFYNASGKDWNGKSTKTVTYMLSGVEANWKGNARQAAAKRIVEAGNTLTATPTDAQCYALGLALHYMTDMTQPMHATSFSALEIPTMLHAALEEWVPMIQGKFPPTGAWDARWKGMTPDKVFHETSLKSGNELAGPLMKSLEYKGTICSMNPETGALYTGMCFIGVPEVENAVGVVLRQAYQSTASYIYSAFNTTAK